MADRRSDDLLTSDAKTFSKRTAIETAGAIPRTIEKTGRPLAAASQE